MDEVQEKLACWISKLRLIGTTSQKKYLNKSFVVVVCKYSEVIVEYRWFDEEINVIERRKCVSNNVCLYDEIAFYRNS